MKVSFIVIGLVIFFMLKVYYSLKTEPYRAMANNNRHQPQPLAASQPRPQQAQPPPRASSSGLHLPITSLASLHAKPSNNADNGSLSSSNTKTKPTSHAIGTLNMGGGGTGHHMHNNNVKPKKAAGFSLPLNNLPSVLPKAHIVTQGGTQAIESMGFKSHNATGGSSGIMGHPAGADAGLPPGVPHVGNAQSKRCRFALKDNSNTNQTSTSSNASTVIEQIPHSNSSHREPNTHHRRSRSPKRTTVTVGMMGPAGPGSQSQTASSSAGGAVHHGSHVTLQENQGGVEFRAPLMIEQASRHVNPVPFETAKLSLFDYCTTPLFFSLV